MRAILDGVSLASKVRRISKEPTRRAIQFRLKCRVRNGDVRILQNDIDQALDELLFSGGSLNRALLGASGASPDEPE